MQEKHASESEILNMARDDILIHQISQAVAHQTLELLVLHWNVENAYCTEW